MNDENFRLLLSVLMDIRSDVHNTMIAVAAIGGLLFSVLIGILLKLE